MSLEGSKRILRGKRPLVLVIMVAIICLLVWIALHRDPKAALHQFHTYGDGVEEAVAEDMLMDPLILAGKRVVPLVIEEVRNREMPRRRYAIGFLGNGSYRQALPVLEQILSDASEIDYFRGDALHAIYLIDGSLGCKYAQVHGGDRDYVGRIACDILAGRSWLKDRRSYWDALVGRHD
jgi:hypothetical protein